ncbi:PilZ domain-containing protein [Thiohalorhabdus sp. Cl-TMA]|uniref:PilZ domain-containing protein n=1 Tax=Thiohalorhabdus methylotrophus TaxID=3242694 RepID=A0ABV4TXK6_9GAMM
MEHRRARRRPVNLHVLVRHQGTPVAFCSTLDISLEGARLHCGALGLEPGSLVEVDLSLPEGDDRYIRLPALVVHCTEGRLGVLFTGVDNADVDTLSGFLHHAPEVDPERRGGGTCYSIFL